MNILSFIKQSSIYSLSTFLSRAITLLLVPFYVRVLSPQDYGIVDILTASVTLINLTIALEIHQAVARFYNDWSEKEKPIYVSTAFWFTLIVYSVFIMLMFPFKSQLGEYFMEDNTRLKEIYATFFMTWTSGVYYFTQSQLRWQLKATKHAITSIVFTLVTTLFTMLFVLFMHLGVYGVLMGLSIGNLFASILAILFARDTYKLKFHINKLREMLRFSTPLVLSSISIFFSLFIDRILIKELLDLTQLGLFSIALKFASVVGLFLSGINNALTPLIYSHYKETNTPKQIEKIFRLFILLSLIIFLGITLNSNEILSLFTTKAYYAAAPVIPILVLTTLMSSAYNFTPGLFIANRTIIISYINLFVAGLNFMLNILLIPLWGIMGAGIASLIGYFFSFLIYYYYNQKYYPIEYYWSRYIIGVLLVMSVVILVFYFPRFNLLTSLAVNAGVIILVSVILTFVLFGTKLVIEKMGHIMKFFSRKNIHPHSNG